MGLVSIRKTAAPQLQSAPRAYTRAFKQLVADLETIVTHVTPMILAHAHPGSIAYRFGTGLEAHNDAHAAWENFRRGLAAAYNESMQEAGAEEWKKLGLHHARFFVAKAKTSIVVPPNPYSLEWIKQSGGDKMRVESQTQREVVREIVSHGYAKGARPETIAENLKRVVGLTERQAQAVETRRQQALDETADEKFANGVADDYAETQLAYRVETIARTENAAAREQGRQDSWLVARDEGDLPATAKRRWVSFPSGPRLCEDCAALDDQIVGLDEQFQSDEYGEVDVPPLHPSCRCTVVLEFE